jgi:hypothetical protein
MLLSTAAFLVRAGFLIMWLPLDVRGFRSVRAREGHTVRPSCELGAVQDCRRSSSSRCLRAVGQGCARECWLLYFAAVCATGEDIHLYIGQGQR